MSEIHDCLQHHGQYNIRLGCGVSTCPESLGPQPKSTDGDVEPSTNMSKADLLAIAADRGVKADSSMTKDEIIDAINEV